MKCDEVIRELAVPTDDRNSAALAVHLATCSSCASWALRNTQFDQLWNATRPAEPLSQAWDGVWARIISSLDSVKPADAEVIAQPAMSSNGSFHRFETPLGSTLEPSRSRTWSWKAIGLVGLAQAAAILLVVGLTWHSFTMRGQPQITVAANAHAIPPDDLSKVSKVVASRSVPAVEIEAGQLVVIRVEDSAVKIVDLIPDGIFSSVDDWLLVFNAVEGIADPVIAMKE